MAVVEGAIEVGELIAEAALTFIPGLVDIPVVGRVLLALQGPHHGDTQVLEELKKVADSKKTDRKTRIERNARYVIKASDAMQCVETHLMDGQVLLSVGKGLINAILGRSGGTGPDLLADAIFTCIEEKVLRQDTPRVIADHKSKYVRPRKGHGHGRGKF